MKQILLLAAISLISIGTFACDVCGAGAATAAGGLMPFYHKNYLRASWVYTPFETIKESGKNTNDFFRTAEITFRCRFSERWKIEAGQSFSFNARESDLEGHQKLNGRGDTRVSAFYTLINRRQVTDESTLSGEIGIGAVLPTGEYDANIHRKNLPENFNPGNGTWGTSMGMNWIWQFEKIGFSSGTNMLFNFESSGGYRYGNQFSTNLILFTKQKIGETNLLMPFGGIYHEKIFHDDYSNNNKVEGTGGKGLYAQAGLNFVHNEWIIGASLSQPPAHEYSDNEAVPKTRFSINATYFINSFRINFGK